MEKPNSSFMKDLKLLDSRLDCYLNHELCKKRDDIYDPVFVITMPRPVGGPVIVHMVHNNGHFRQPDNRDLEILHGGDSWAFGGPSKYVEFRAKLMEKAREDQERRTRETLRDLTKDYKYQLMNTFSKAAGSGKGQRHVQRIIPKPKGITIKDLRKLNTSTSDTE